MRFLISVIDDTTRSPHTPDGIAAINAFNDQIQATGQRILACGLDAPSKAVVVDNRKGNKAIEQGPFFESKEFFSGFWVVQADSLEAATELALQGSLACNRKVELRPLLDP